MLLISIINRCIGQLLIVIIAFQIYLLKMLMIKYRIFISLLTLKHRDYKEIKRDYDSIFTVNGTNDSTTTQIGFDEYGIYTLLVFDDLSVLSIIDSKGHSTLPPFFITVGICILFFIIWSWGIWFYEKRKEKKNDGYNQLLDIKKTIKKERMISLDIFRGISLAVMIFANYGSGGYSWFLHADWDGLTCADFVFPWFMWISGASLFLSFHAIKMHGNGWNVTLKMLWKITKRAISLELLGIFLNNASNLKHARISGVLQYFAIIGFINGLILLFVPLFDWKNKKFIKKWDERFIEIDKYFFSHIFEWMVMLIFPVVYLLVERLTTVPGCPRGYVGPGGIGDWGLYPDCTGGIHTYIDKKIFTLDHMYSGTKPVYRTGQYDPEGILGGVNAIFLCSLGVVCIQIYHCFSSLHSRIIYNTLMGLIFCGIAGGLCGFSQHDGIIPINKNLCSTSFVFLMSGTGTLLLLIFHILSDVFHLYSGFPFLAVGMNSIILYAGHEVFAGYFPFTFDSEVYDHWYCMESGILGTTMWIIIAQYWKHIGFFVKI